MKHVCTHCAKVITRSVHPNTKRPFCDSRCYGEWQKGKTFELQSKTVRPKKTCSVDGCESTHFGKGYCRKHYLSIHYTPKENPSKSTLTAKIFKCNHCGKDFYAKHKNPKFCSMSCSSSARTKPFIIKKGYKKILVPSHPRADKKGYVFEHILVVESVIGRPVTKIEEIHHIDFNKQNNSPDNLLLCANHAEHMKHHARPS